MGLETITLKEWAASRNIPYHLADKIKTVFRITGKGTFKTAGRPSILYSLATLDKALFVVTGFKNDETTTEVASIDCSESLENPSDTTATIDW